MDFACRVDPGCKKSYLTKQARGLHELVHKPIERRPCPECGRPISVQFMARHQKTHGQPGRRVVKPTQTRPKPERKPATRRTLGAILEELYDAVAHFEAEHARLQTRLDANIEQMNAVQRALDAATAPRIVKPPRR